jgi:uncharacterized protein YjbI with pentapeptide repeats
MPWRLKPEIDEARQQFLAERRAVQADIAKHVYPFKGVTLDRADVEWLLATHESGGVLGPVDWRDETQYEREGLDLRGAVLSSVDLSGMPLARLVGGLTFDEINRTPLTPFPVQGPLYQAAFGQAIETAAIHLEGARLWNAELTRASLMGAHLEAAVMLDTHLERADLTFAHLEQATLWATHLERASLGLAHLERAQAPGAYLEAASLSSVRASHVDMLGAHLDGADLNGGHLEGARFGQSQLAGVILAGARLEGAVFDEAHMEGKEMDAEAFQRVRQWDPTFQACQPPTNLSAAFLDADTSLKGTVLGDEKRGGISLVDAHLDGVNLAAARLEQVKSLGEERIAQQAKRADGTTKDDATRLSDYQTAVRANRQFAVALRNQGLNEMADHFMYRAQVLQRGVLRLEGKRSKLAFSWCLDRLAGYGFRPGRTLVLYLGVLTASTMLFFWQAMTLAHHPLWYEKLGESFVAAITAMHGRGFLPGQVQSGWQLGLAAFDAVAGLIVEASFVATFVQRFFGSK